ncbi:MAG: ChaN family lipoprotein [Rubrivivax sp.]|nr:ChaN family lipoprotein [Rubrivivax sp.]
MSAAAARWLLVALLLAGCATTEPIRLDFSRPLVLLGEVHDNAAQHALRLQAFDAWLARGGWPALLMEQFDRERQPDIERLRAQQPPADAAALIAAAGGAGWDWRYYQPFVERALRHDLPLVAVNVSRADARRVMSEGLAAQGFDAAVPAAVSAAIAQAIQASHCGQVDAATAQRMALAQVARDQFMARAVAAHAGRGVLLLAGNGHVRADIGVPRWLDAATRARSQAIGLIEVGDDSGAVFDLVLRTAAQPRRDPCR